MYVHSSVQRLVGAIAFTLLIAHAAVVAQQPENQHEGHEMPHDEHAGHDMAEMSRQSSGTAWLPLESPIYAVHATRGPWMLMFHENAFLQFLHESAERRDDQVGSINW